MMTCWFTRRNIARALDDETPLSESDQRHLHTCADCEQHWNAQRHLVGLLTQEAHQESFTPSPFLRGRIVAAVRHAAAPASDVGAGPQFSWLGGLALTVLAATLVVVGVIQQRPDPQPSSNKLLTSVIHFSGDQVLEETTGQTFGEWSVALNQPLESELQFVMNDARIAIDSLAASFIPESLLAGSSVAGR